METEAAPGPAAPAAEETEIVKKKRTKRTDIPFRSTTVGLKPPQVQVPNSTFSLGFSFTSQPCHFRFKRGRCHKTMFACVPIYILAISRSSPSLLLCSSEFEFLLDVGWTQAFSSFLPKHCKVPLSQTANGLGKIGSRNSPEILHPLDCSKSS